MSEKTYTIGELARLSGCAVRKIRFYADKGLLPPLGRTLGGYRVFTDADVARLDLIRALREAGIGLEAIGRILARRLSLTDVLRVRLETLEAEIAAQQRIASVLRATLRSPEPGEADLRRLWTMTQLSQTQFRQLIEGFFDGVTEGAPIDAAWRQQLIAANLPELPDELTPRQIDAWNELAAMLTDRAFIEETRQNMAKAWNDGFDQSAYIEASNATLAKVRKAIDRGESPTSPSGAAIANAWLEQSARAMQREPDQAFMAWQMEQYRQHDGRSARYQELLAVLRGEELQASNEWTWLHEAMKPLIAA